MLGHGKPPGWPDVVDAVTARRRGLLAPPRSAEQDPDAPDPRGFSQGAIALLAVVGVVGLVLLLRSPSTPVQVIEVPDRGEVVARTLPDGTPVWVVAATDGDVRVVEALTPSTGPIGGIVGWCAAGQRYVDPILGVSFAPDGTRYNGVIPGRLGRADDPRTGLRLLRFEAGGGARAGDPLRIGDAREPSREVRDAPIRGELGNGPPLGCRLPDPDDPETGGGLSGLLHHGGLADDFDATREGWQLVRAYVQVEPDGRTRLCEQRDGGFAPECADVAGARVDLGLREEAPGTVTTRVGTPLAVRVENGTIVGVAVLPTSAWIGSSLRRTETEQLTLIGWDEVERRVLVRPSPDRSVPPCVSPAPPRLSGGNDEAFVVYLSEGADVFGSDQFFGAFSTDSARVALEVDVVIDRVTCRALAVREAG